MSTFFILQLYKGGNIMKYIPKRKTEKGQRKKNTNLFICPYQVKNQFLS